LAPVDHVPLAVEDPEVELAIDGGHDDEIPAAIREPLPVRRRGHQSEVILDGEKVVDDPGLVETLDFAAQQVDEATVPGAGDEENLDFLRGDARTQLVEVVIAPVGRYVAPADPPLDPEPRCEDHEVATHLAAAI